MNKKLEPLIIGDLEIEIPIVQGAMGVRVSTAPLCAAVAECGGAGTIAGIGLGYGTEENQTNFTKASRESLIKEIRMAKKLTDGVVGVNLMVAVSNYDDLARTAVREKTDFIASGAGLPLKLPEIIDNSPTKLIPIISSARAANIIIKTWKKRYNRFPDAIVLEGPLAGGHLGFKFDDLKSHNRDGLETLLTEVLKVTNGYEKDYNINMPVIAAGGIFDGQDIARFLQMGAKGVQVATRFVTTFECTVSERFKELYINAKEEDIIIIKSPVGMPGRAIRTEFIDKVMNGEKIPFKCNYQCLRSCNPRTAPYCIAEALFNAVCGDIENAVVFAGKNVSKIKEIVSVRELMDSLVSETVEELDRCGQLA